MIYGEITCHTELYLYGIVYDSVVSAESVNSLKLGLAKFWSMHDFVYDYRAN